MLARKRGDPQVVRRNWRAARAQRDEYVGIVPRGSLVRLEERDARRSHESLQLLTVLSRPRAGGETCQELGQDDERQVNFASRPQRVDRGRHAPYEPAVDVRIERDGSHRRDRARRRFTR